MHYFMYLSHIWEKLAELIHYPLVWVSGLLLFIADALSGGRLIIYIVLVAAVVDLICGIAVAIKRKEFTRSDLMRQTVEKILVYGLVLIVFICIDHVVETETGFQTDISSGLVGVVMTLTEAVSFTASLLIMYPNNAFLRMFQKALKGELARKLNCEESEVDKILAMSRKKKAVHRAKNGQFAKAPVKKSNKR